MNNDNDDAYDDDDDDNDDAHDDDDDDNDVDGSYYDDDDVDNHDYNDQLCNYLFWNKFLASISISVVSFCKSLHILNSLKRKLTI